MARRNKRPVQQAKAKETPPYGLEEDLLRGDADDATDGDWHDLNDCEDWVCEP